MVGERILTRVRCHLSGTVAMLAAYHGALKSAPLATKSVTSAVLALAGQRIASIINGAKVTPKDMLAYGAYGCVRSMKLPGRQVWQLCVHSYSWHFRVAIRAACL